MNQLNARIKHFSEEELMPKSNAETLALRILAIPSLMGDDEKTRKIRREIIETISKHNA